MTGPTAQCAPTTAAFHQLAGRDLTNRELDILDRIADGQTNDQIADRLGITIDTAKTHVRRLCSKLGASNRAHAVAIGIRNGWIR